MSIKLLKTDDYQPQLFIMVVQKPIYHHDNRSVTFNLYPNIYFLHPYVSFAHLSLSLSLSVGIS